MKDLKNKHCKNDGSECKPESSQGSREGTERNEKHLNKQGQTENKYFGQDKSQDSREGAERNERNEKPGHKHGHQQGKKSQPHEEHVQEESNRTRHGRESDEEQSHHTHGQRPQSLGKHDLDEINQSGLGGGKQEYGQQIHRKK